MFMEYVWVCIDDYGWLMDVIVVVVMTGQLLGSRAYVGANGSALNVPATHHTPGVHLLRLGAFKPPTEPNCTSTVRELSGNYW